ncbi:TniQ family protein [Metarhizobium album]|nr:TniQ family protein [Rhizobium album]
MGINASMYLPFSNWSVKPCHGEPAHGYFLRLVANEGHYSASVYANEIGLNGRRLTPEEALGTLLKLPINEDNKDTLRRFSPIADGAYYDLGGQRLRQRQMSFTTRRFCRACLADAPHHRVWWDILAFRKCPEHGTVIEDVDVAGQPIGWWWADITSDTSGNPLAAYAPSQADWHARSLEALIVERLTASPTTSWTLLGQYQLFEVIEACEYLGMWLGNDRTRMIPADPMEKLAVGMSALEGSRDDLVAAMHAWFIEMVPSQVRRDGKMESMGWAWNAWPKLPGTEIGNMLNQASNEAFEPIGKMGKKRFRETGDFYAERALSALAIELDIRMEALVPLARHLAVIPLSAEPWELDSAQADALRRAIADLIPSSEVTGILGLETWEWQNLVGSGRLVSFGHFALGRMFIRSEVEGFVKEVLDKVPVRDVESVSLRSFGRRKGLSVDAVLIQALDGKIATVRAASCADLRAIRVVAESRRRLNSRSVVHAPEVEVVTMAEAAAMVQLNHGTVSRLVELGALERAAGGVLRRESVLGFHRRFASAQIYRSTLGCMNFEVEDELSAIGVSTCFGLRNSSAVVERSAARRALGISCDPDDARVASSDLWEKFRAIAIKRCPMFTLPPTITEVGAKLRTATRKVVVDVSVDGVTGAISLGFDLHPTLTSRRWKIFEKRETEIREALGCMEWKASEDGAGWRLSWVVSDCGDLGSAADALSGMHRCFK